MEEKIRWEFKLVKSSQSFRSLWEFLDQDGNGLLSHRQFLYQMKQPKRRAAVNIMVTTVEADVGVGVPTCTSGPIGKLEIVSLVGSHLPKVDAMKEIDTYCALTYGAQQAHTNVAKKNCAPQWTFPGRDAGTKRELASVEFSVESLRDMPPMEIKVFEEVAEVEDVQVQLSSNESEGVLLKEANEIGEVEISAEDIVDIMGAGNVSNVFLSHISACVWREGGREGGRFIYNRDR